MNSNRHRSFRISVLLCLIVCQMFLSNLGATESDLWKDGKRADRLPDFSFAGYQMGEKPIPNLKKGKSLLSFGAVEGKDSTEAFKKAIEHGGVIEIPAGKFYISDILWIKKSGVVLRGAGRDKTFIIPTKDLEDVRPNMSSTTSGRATSGYSWSGGFLWIKGSTKTLHNSEIISEAKRNGESFSVKDAKGFKEGMLVHVLVTDDDQQSLIHHLYAGDPGDIQKVKRNRTLRFSSRIKSLSKKTITLERPLPYDLRPEWKPRLSHISPTVQECGIENLTIHFKPTPYQGHFTETGKNGIAINSGYHCWIRNVQINNSDSGIYIRGTFCTAENIVVTSERKPKGADTGHHGIDLGQDSLLTNFDIQTQFIHDISFGYFTRGNVVKNGKGKNISLDHHKCAPMDNLFCNLDAGLGKNIWRCGGGKSLGKHGARGNTYWGIKAKHPMKPPRKNFGPAAMNFVGLTTDHPETKDLKGVWWERIDDLTPLDLHAAQLKARLKK